MALRFFRLADFRLPFFAVFLAAFLALLAMLPSVATIKWRCVTVQPRIRRALHFDYYSTMEKIVTPLKEVCMPRTDDAKRGVDFIAA